RLVAAWGEALAGFCVERGPVARVTVSEWAGSDGHVAPVGRDDQPSTAAEDTYRDLLESDGGTAMAHDALVAVTVEARRLRAGRGSRADALMAALGEQLRLLAARLNAAGLRV